VNFWLAVILLIYCFQVRSAFH